jgi:hypothetical protein
LPWVGSWWKRAPKTVHHVKAQREGRTLDEDETVEFSFSGDRISRLDVTFADQAAVEAFWCEEYRARVLGTSGLPRLSDRRHCDSAGVGWLRS